MREIKFRAWLKEFEFMIEPKEIGSVSNDEVRLKNPWNIENQGWVDTYSRNEVEVMQYTGLKDKHGTEIFEGDIVNVKYSYDYPTLEGYERNYLTVVGTVKFDHGSFDVARPANGPFDIGEKEVWQGIIPQENLTDIETEWEIIGNIYENPELLEGGESH